MTFTTDKGRALVTTQTPSSPRPDPPSASPVDDRTRARFFRACAVGAVLAVAVFAWFVLKGGTNLFAKEGLYSNFYEVQARSLLQGHWDVPADALGAERFNVGGRFYMYQGPGPALLRLPFVAFTDGLDGRLVRSSMLLAFAVLLWSAATLCWQARRLVLGTSALGRRGEFAAAGFVFAAGAGTTALFLGSSMVVFHEAILWSVAWALASSSFLISYLVHGRRAALVGASATAALAFLSRGSVGLGPVVALAVVFAIRLVANLRGRPRPLLPVAIATVVPTALYAYVNMVKFGTMFGLPPIEKQDLLASWPPRIPAMAANGGSLFGEHYAPSILLQYLRPDAIGFDRLFPWVGFSSPPRILGGAVFEAVNFSVGIPATSTLIVALAIVGIVAVLRPARRDRVEPVEAERVTVAVLRAPLIGAVLGCIGAISLAFIDQRYEGDFVPLLILAAAVGLWAVARSVASRRRRVRTVVAVVLTLLGVWSAWATGAVTLLYQRAYAPAASTEDRAGLLDAGITVHQALGAGAVSGVRHGSALPSPGAPANELFVIGDCDGLYWSDGRAWRPVEKTPATGRFRLRMRPDASPPGTFEPLLSARDQQGTGILWVHRLAPDRIRFEYEWKPAGGDQDTEQPSARGSGIPDRSERDQVTEQPSARGSGIPDRSERDQVTEQPSARGSGIPDRSERDQVTEQPTIPKDQISSPLRMAPGRAVDVDVRFDYLGTFLTNVEVRAEGRELLEAFTAVARAEAVVSRQDVSARGAATLAGTVRELPVMTPVCDRLMGMQP